MSRLSKTWRIRLRWGIVFQPLCLVLKHDMVWVEAGTWADPSGKLCQRCGRFKEAKWQTRR